LKNIIYSCFKVLFFFFSSLSVCEATHIVGGDLTYRFIERVGDDNRYTFTLKIYYDCFPLDGQAALDSDTSIMLAIYQRMTISPELWRLVGSNGSRRLTTVRRSPLRRIDNPTFECLVPPTNVCVFEGIFEFEVILKRIPMPYVITYQRCCRNNTITNLIQGGSTGASFTVELTPEAQELGNSTPTFTTYPNTIVCLNEPLVYNHTASDADGDRLVYRFCQPTSSPGLAGRPECYQAPNSSNYNCPPPMRIANNYPQYPPERPMYGEPLVKIDSLTGRITGTPVSFGGFVVSVCVEEYRGNVLMSKVYRDFQFNVLVCPRKVETRLNQADSTNLVGEKRFIISKCDSTTVRFVNNSRQTQFINSFYWEFNIDGTNQRFTDFSPTITFPRKGFYRGMLWLNRGQRCYDSAFVDVLIGAGMDANFKVQFDSCHVTPINFTNQTLSPVFPIRSYRWDLGDTIITDYANTVQYQYRTNGVKRARLTLTNRFGCSDDTVRTFEYLPMPPSIQIASDVRTGCVGLKVNYRTITPLLDSTYRVEWDFGDGSSLTNFQLSPSHVYARAGNFSPTLRVSNLQGCKRLAILGGGLQISPNPTANFDFDPKVVSAQGGEVNFKDQSSTDVVLWRWRFGNRGVATVQHPQFNFKDTGSVPIRLFVRNSFNCLDSITKNIFVEPFVSFYMPNVFTPNNDGLNDIFIGKGIGLNSLKSFSFKILNRWGEIIFESQQPNVGWNGQKQNIGEDLPQGTYVYVVQYINFVGKQTTIKDYFQLIR
jgi:gliding motility-associated-like protein